MADLITWLERFNRKERFFLVAQALGKPKFELSEEFRKTLSGAAGPGMEIPADGSVFVAMDYHLDWIHAAMRVRGVDSDGAAVSNRTDANAAILVGNQEDVDLVVAWSHADVAKVILLEAKAETGWTNGQLRSKRDRLSIIFGEDPPADVVPRFVLTSPKESLGIDANGWPAWMLREDNKPRWFELKVPPGRWRAVRTSRLGEQYVVRPASTANVVPDRTEQPLNA